MLSLGIIYWSLTAGLIMKLVLAVVGCLVLAGCVTASVEPFTTNDGRAGYIARCGGALMDVTDCYETARATCAGNYEIVLLRESPREGAGTDNRRLEFVCEA